MSHATALYAFEATHETHLPLASGQRVLVLDALEGGWSFGQAETGERGHFPSEFVQLDQAGTLSSAHTAHGEHVSGALKPRTLELRCAQS